MSLTRIRSRLTATVIVAVLFISAALSAIPVRAAASDVLIFAAASMQTALDELAPQVQQATSVHIRMSYAASSALAHQLESGAPAEIFISADEDWMDYAVAHHSVVAASRVTLVGNTLVLVAPATQPAAVAIGPGFPLAQKLGTGRLAIGEPTSVPAGKYAKAALTSLHVWDSISDKLAPSENVRAALALVSRGEAPLGIVYRTDALADRGVAIVGTFPANSHPPIIYPAALTPGASADAARVLSFLQGAEAKAVFARQGFLVGAK